MSKREILILVVVVLLLVSGYFLFGRSGQEIKDPDPIQVLEEFNGDKGERVDLVNGEINLSTEVFDDNLAHYYNTKISSGKVIYFFVVKDKNGIYRAAANACQICFGARMGFSQEGDFMVCNTCGNKYPLEKIATEKGGCNPGPINPNLEIKDGQIIIKESELKQVADFF